MKHLCVILILLFTASCASKSKSKKKAKTIITSSHNDKDAIIRRILSQNLQNFSSCSDGEETAAISFIVTKKGIQRLKVTGETQELRDCIRDEVLRLRIPKTQGRDVIEIDQTFNF